METFNIATLAKHFTNEASAWELVEKMRWANGPVCPHCGVINHAYLLKSSPTSTGKESHRKTWKCADCRRKFSVLIGTIFEGTQVPLSKWLMAIYLMSASKNGVAAYELHRTLNVTHKTAWFMIHRIREGMKLAPVSAMMRGTVVADETWIGGNPQNMHANKRVGSKQGKTAKTPVLSLVNKETGEVRSQAIPDVTGATLRNAISQTVVMSETTLHTDSAHPYKRIGKDMAGHIAVNHFIGQYVLNGAGTNEAEGYFSQLKRSIDGTHHHVSVEHLNRYLAEFDFRYTTRKMSDSDRMVQLMGQTGMRRLTYKRLIGKP